MISSTSKPNGRSLRRVRLWTRHELWTVTATIVFVAALIVWGYRDWDDAYSQHVDAESSIRQSAIDSCKILPEAQCNALIVQAFSRVQEGLDEAREHADTDSWLKPLVHGTAFVALPIVLLVLHLIWGRGQRRSRTAV